MSSFVTLPVAIDDKTNIIKTDVVDNDAGSDELMKIMLMEKIKMMMKGIKKPELEVARFVAEDVKVNFVEVGVGRAFLVQTPSGGSGGDGGVGDGGVGGC